MAKVFHFEIPADDVERAKKFYGELFGWSFEKLTEGDHWMITTNGKFPLNGGLLPRQHPEQKVTNYVDVPSVDEYTTRAKRLGARVVVEKRPVRGMGYYSVCKDMEDNTFGIWQNDKSAH